MKLNAESETLSISPEAAGRLRSLFEAEGDPDLMLRLSVHGGGCSGFRYAFDFETSTGEGDRTFERDGAKVVVDEMSLELVAGSQLHYRDELVGAFFEVRNPNAASACGCGASFAV